MHNASILIVDDTVENIDLLKAVLESRDFDVKTASSGLQAIAAILESIKEVPNTGQELLLTKLGGANDGARTRDNQNHTLGLYQLSYVRRCRR